MQKIPLNEVVIENRQREDYGDIDALKSSLTKYGQLQPIGIDQNKRLLWGGRRLMAAAAL